MSPGTPTASAPYMGQFLRLNRPDWYAREDFRTFLNGITGRQPATWHTKGGPPDDYSDVFVTIDECEGSDTDLIPPDIWEEIVKLAEEHWHGPPDGLVWISNLEC